MPTLLLCLLLGLWTACQSRDQAAPTPASTWSQHYEAGRSALAKGQHAQAEQEFRAALQVAGEPGGQDERLAQTLQQLAQLLALQGRNAPAESLYLRLLDLQERALGAQAPPVALTLSQLADLSRSQKNYARAESLYARSLSIQEQALDPHDPQLAAALDRLAELHRARGEYAQADSLSRWAMSRTLRAQAYSSFLKGQYPQAELLYQRSLGIQEKTLGLHPDLARTCCDLGRLYELQGRYPQAETFYRRALGIQEKTLGDHLDLAQTLDNLAGLLQKGKRGEEAAPLAERAQRIRQSRASR